MNQNVIASLVLMGKGMAAIFVVILLIYFIVTMLLKFTSDKV